MPYDDKFKSLMDNVFSGPRPLFSLSEKIWNPPTDVYEVEEAVIVRMEISGVKEEDIDISVDNNMLIIKGLREEYHPAPKQNYHLMEIHYGKFERMFRLPAGLNTDLVQADYCRGFLTVSIKKQCRKPTSVKIEITE